MSDAEMLGKQISGLGLAPDGAVETWEGNPLALVGRFSRSVLYKWADGRWIACYHAAAEEGLWRELTPAEAESWKAQWLSR